MNETAGEYLDRLEETYDEVKQLRAGRETLVDAAKEAEKLLDVMALDGIKNWLTPRLLELYPEIHTALRKALADLEDGDA